MHIDEELIANALKLKTGYFSLTDKISDLDKNTTFLTLPGMSYTYKDLVHKEMELPLHLYAHHFTLTRPVRYTKPSMRLATLFTKSLTKMLPTPNFARYILSEMHQHAASKGVKDSPYLGAGHILTQIAYQVLGVMEQLSPQENQ